MKPRAQVLGTDDRISTREELGEVIGLMIMLQRLPFEAALEFLEKSDSRSDVEDLELWTDADHEGRTGTEVEPLTNIILGHRQRPN